LWQPSGGCHDRRVAGTDLDHLTRNAAGLRRLLAAARAVCRRIAGLSQAATEHALATGRVRMLDRTLHWLPHLEALEAEPRG
jgi:hypothetical protein